jgi:hypothetical protein
VDCNCVADQVTISPDAGGARKPGMLERSGKVSDEVPFIALLLAEKM